MSETEDRRPFVGLKVVDVSHVLAGPFCTYQLALLGADVVRVEPPEGKDIARHGRSDPKLTALGLAPGFLCQNANKRSIALDLKKPRGKEVMRRLVERADVLTENFRPGVMDRLGFGYAKCRELNPRLIYCAMTGYGQTGPLSQLPAYDHIMQGFSGMMTVVGAKETGPARIGFPVIDYLLGLYGAFGIASALHQRARTGAGQFIDVAMLDVALTIMGPLLSHYLNAGVEPAPPGRLAFSGRPFSGVFAAAEGTILISAATERQVRALLKVIGRPELAEDPRCFAWPTPPGFADEAHGILSAAFRAETAAFWERRLNEAEVPAGMLRGIPEILRHPHVEERRVVRRIDGVPGIDRTVHMPGPGFHLADGDGEVVTAPPRKGEHTAAILGELGYGAAEIEELAAAGVVVFAENREKSPA